jgi:serine/threonine-protein kinase
MSPEQASGGELDHRSDMYSFGVVMYEVFTGRVPFEADTFMGVMTQHMYVQPTPPREIVDGTELGVLEDITLRCLEKNPKERYPSMQDVSADLRRAVTVSSDGIVVVRPSTRGVSPPVQSVLSVRAGARGSEPLPLEPHVPRRMTIAVATVAGVGLAALLLAWLGKDAPSDSEPPTAASQASTAEPLKPPARPSAAVPKVEATPLVSATGTAAPGQPAHRATESGGSTGAKRAQAASSKVRRRPSAKTAPLLPKRDKKPKSLGQTSGGEIIDPWSRRASAEESPTH